MAVKAKEARQDEFIRALVDSNGSAVGAGKATQIPRQTYHRWFKNDEEFKKRTEEIFPQIERELFETCVQRAKEKSDVLLIFILKALNPQRYDDAMRKQIHEERKQEATRVGAQDCSLDPAGMVKLLRQLIEADPCCDYGIRFTDRANTQSSEIAGD